MAWDQQEFNDQAEFCRDLPGANEMTVGDGTAMVASAIFHIGALLAERLPKPGPRLYEVKRGDRKGLVLATDRLAMVYPIFQQLSTRFLVSVQFADATDEEVTALPFDSMEDASAERAELIAAWRGDA